MLGSNAGGSNLLDDPSEVSVFVEDGDFPPINDDYVLIFSQMICIAEH